MDKPDPFECSFGIGKSSERNDSGTFTAHDPEGDSLTYHLVSGTGHGNNSMFTMETNGTLRTAAEFDYESYQTLNVRVKALDPSNESVEGAFSIQVTNVEETHSNLQ